MKISALVLTVFLLYFQPISIQSNEKIVPSNLTLNDIIFEIYKTNYDLIENILKEVTSKETKQLYNGIGHIVNDYYGNLTSSEKKNLSIKISIILEIYSKLKDLLIHDIRTGINYLRGKWSTASLDRSITININIFTDVLDKLSIYHSTTEHSVRKT